MTKQLLLLSIMISAACMSAAQSPVRGIPGKAKSDSIAHAKMVNDSLNMERLFALAEYPLIKGSKWSGVFPVVNATEVPDPARQYKLLFELTAKNPDSISNDINQSLDEVARILNLHVASGIPAKNIIPVIVIHGPGIEAVVNNETYRKKHQVDNPNLQIIGALEKVGAKFIVCGQAMEYFNFKREELLPEIKISLTAKTVLSGYQGNGYILNVVVPEK